MRLNIWDEMKIEICRKFDSRKLNVYDFERYIQDDQYMKSKCSDIYFYLKTNSDTNQYELTVETAYFKDEYIEINCSIFYATISDDDLKVFLKLKFNI